MLCDRFASILEDVYGTSMELAELAKDYKNELFYYVSLTSIISSDGFFDKLYYFIYSLEFVESCDKNNSDKRT